MTTAEAISVAVPDIGDFDDVPIIEILVSVGDAVAAEDPLVTLESDKATMDVPAPSAGTVREIQVKVGDRVSQGAVLMTLEPESGSGDDSAGETSSDSGGEAKAAPASTAEAAEEQDAPGKDPEPEGQPEPKSTTGNGGGPPARAGEARPIYASPAVRRFARELGVELAGWSGSGRKGRITKDDVQGFKQAGGTAGDGSAETSGRASGGSIPGLEMAPWPKVNFERYGPVERVQRSRIQKISAPNLARNWVMIPHVTHNDEADITDLEAWRKQLNQELSQRDDAGAARSGEAGRRAGGKPAGVKMTMVSFLIAASVVTLKEFPGFNASLDGDELVLRRYYNIGFAADTPGGLVVPVIKGADQKGLVEIARELTALSAKAREGKLSSADMSGGTFTISSLGGIGGTSFTPIINAPEVAILGVTRSAIKPVWDGSEFQPRLMVPLSLSYDHRVIDGAAAARFVAHLVGVLSDLRRALL
jgi:pyruvate dehydrogenase E2 component (dihydrolipoamide acetyltransferase)